MREPRSYILGRLLRSVFKSMIAIDAILISMFSVWLVGMFLWRAGQWLYRWVFSHPW